MADLLTLLKQSAAQPLSAEEIKNQRRSWIRSCCPWVTEQQLLANEKRIGVKQD